MVVATELTALCQHMGASLADLEWTVNAYTLSFAVLLMTVAALGDRLGRRRVFAAGLAVFAAGSAARALAPDAAALIAARAVQGAGAATIMPMALALLNAVFPPARQGWVIGIYGGVTALAAVTRAATSEVPTADLGTASGAFATMRQLGGAFGVAVFAAVFASAGSYATPGAFSRGFAAAYAVAAVFAAAGAAVGLLLPGLSARRSPTTAHVPAPALRASGERGR